MLTAMEQACCLPGLLRLGPAHALRHAFVILSQIAGTLYDRPNDRELVEEAMQIVEQIIKVIEEQK